MAITVYVAGPYTAGVPLTNVSRALTVAEDLLKRGYAPFVPHLTYYWEASYRHNYETWLELDFAWLERCDALLRFDSDRPSPGADREITLAQARGIPVFYSVEELHAHFHPPN